MEAIQEMSRAGLEFGFSQYRVDFSDQKLWILLLRESCLHLSTLIRMGRECENFTSLRVIGETRYVIRRGYMLHGNIDYCLVTNVSHFLI